jgi:hypothetical protein
MFRIEASRSCDIDTGMAGRDHVRPAYKQPMEGTGCYCGPERLVMQPPRSSKLPRDLRAPSTNTIDSRL